MCSRGIKKTFHVCLFLCSHRASLEQSVAGALSSLEKTAAAHGEEQRRLAEQLATQKQLASKYSDRVSELERETRLRGLELKEAKKELETERSLASKLYDDVRKQTGSTFRRKIKQFVSFPWRVSL